MKLIIAVILCIGIAFVFAEPRNHHSSNSEVIRTLKDMMVKHHRFHDVKQEDEDEDHYEERDEDRHGDQDEDHYEERDEDRHGDQDEDEGDEQNNMLGGLSGLSKLFGSMTGAGGTGGGSQPAPTEPPQPKPQPPAPPAPAMPCVPKPNAISCHTVEKFCLSYLPRLKTTCFAITKHCFNFCSSVMFKACTAKVAAAKGSDYNSCYHRYIKCIY